MPTLLFNPRLVALLLLAVCASSCCTLRSSSPPPPALLTHVVIVWLHPDTDWVKRADIEAGSRALDQIPGVHNLVVGKTLPSDRPVVDDSFDLALSMQFESVEAMNAYVVHPQHQDFLKLAKPHIAKLLVYDFR